MNRLSNKIIYCFGVVVLFALYACQNNSRSNNPSSYSTSAVQKSPTELREELVVTERRQPMSYLSVNATWRKNLIGETVIEGTIVNNATLANFKDVYLQITWLTKTNTELSSETKVIYDYFVPHGSKAFKFKFNAPTDMAGFESKILSATAVE